MADELPCQQLNVPDPITTFPSSVTKSRVSEVLRPTSPLPLAGPAFPRLGVASKTVPLEDDHLVDLPLSVSMVETISAPLRGTPFAPVPREGLRELTSNPGSPLEGVANTITPGSRLEKRDVCRSNTSTEYHAKTLTHSDASECFDTYCYIP